MKGGVFLAKIFFTNNVDFKLRPILVIKEYRSKDVSYLPLTTNLKIKGMILIQKDFSEGELDRDSLVIVDKIGILHKDLLFKKIGLLKKEKIKEIIKELCMSFNCYKD